ncbi:ABC transporter ATP-binding protein, partial [Megasphaera massiliensis]|nr:ABC transporter ATP-binding protein [Megasphaera massiliensis]
QAFGSENRLFRHFVGASQKLRQAQKRTNLLEAYLMSTFLFFTNVNNLVIIAAGSYFIIH